MPSSFNNLLFRVIGDGLPKRNPSYGLLMARAQLVSPRQAVANNIRGLLKTFGFVIARGSNGPIAVRVREVIADNATLSVIVEPLLLAWQALREQVATLD